MVRLQEISTLQTPGPGSSVSQVSGSSSKRSRALTSRIHDHIRKEGDKLICNRYSKVYKSTGGTGAMSRYLKEKHSIDPAVSSVAEKIIREGTSIDAAILRGAEINIKAEEERRQQLLSLDINKNTLEYLYLRWTINQNIAFNQVRDSDFRTFLEYCNPAVNRMLPDSDITIKIHAEALFAEGKQRLRHMLVTALSDIHISCDV